jgi:hypothetical protein
VTIFLGPRYEYALLSGVISPFILALWFACSFDAEKALARRLVPLFTLVVGLLALAALGGLVEGNCEPGYGYGLLLLGPCLGLVSLVVSLNAVLRLLSKKRALPLGKRVAVGLSVPLGVLGYGLWRLYRDPAVFAYSEFSGYFAGPLYDLVDYRLPTLLTYRIGSLLLVFGLLSVETRSAVLRRKIVASLGILAYFCYRGLLGPWLGHELSEASLARALPANLSAGPCAVRYDPMQTAKRSAELVLRQCTLDVLDVANYFEVAPPARVTVSLFASVEEKGRLTGAGRTYVAKPWRREVHLHEAGFPHPTLRHELAHVVSAQFGVGPFLVAGPLGGWIPDPGRIEGVAVAAAPPWESDGTLDEWASAAARLGKLPALNRLFQLGFYGSSAVSAYGAAGAFVSFVRQTYGSRAIRAWYAGESLSGATGHTLLELEAQFLAHLRAVDVPPLVQNAAEQRFSALAVGERRCPHAVDRALGEGAKLCSLDARLAQAHVDRAVLLDPGEADAYLWLSGCYLEAGDVQAGRALLDGYRDGPAWSERERALREADLAFVSGDIQRAEETYRGLAARQSNSGEQRALALRVYALSSEATPLEREAVRLGALSGVKTEARWGALLGYLGLGAGKFVVPYLLGRKLLEERAFQAAAQLLEAAALSPAPHSSLSVEAKRQWFISACAVSDVGAAGRAFDALTQESLTSNQRAEAEHIRGMCK